MPPLTGGSLYKVSLQICPEAEDAAAELLAEIFAQPATVEIDVQRGTTRVSVYLAKRPSVDSTARIKTELSSFEKATIQVSRLRRQDWAESWKRHFKPLKIGRKLLVVPSWSRRKKQPGQALVVLDPGLSFGTGQHPTTRFCLEEITALPPGSMLDFGTGSGILAIAAAKLHYDPIEALDIDPDAVRIAKENARRNRVEDRIRFARKDLTALPVATDRKFDLVCANLIYDVLVGERRRIVSRLRRGGRLVLAGILESQFYQVQAAFVELGLRLVRAKTVKEWRSGAFDFS